MTIYTEAKMRILSFALILLAMLLLSAGNALAATITYNFSGIIHTVRDPQHFLNDSVVANATPFSVKVVFDGSAIDFNPFESIAQYSSIGDPYGYLASVGGINYFTDDFQISVSNNNPNIDGYNFCGQCRLFADQPFPDEVDHIGSLIHLSTFDLTTLTDTELPTFIDPSDYERANSFSINGWPEIGYSGSATPIFSIEGEVLSVTTVPLPAAAWLFGSGLIGIIGFARRKKT